MSTIDETSKRPRGRWWVRVLLAVGCLGLVAMWGYYFFVASDKGVYQLDDKAWRVQAKQVCTAATAERLTLTDESGGLITDPTVAQMAERARLVNRSTDILDKMLADIVAIPVATQRDRDILTVFDKHYRMVLADRRRYADALAAGKNDEYTETVVAGGPVSNVVTDFTAGVKGNDIPECSPPHDLDRISTG